MTDLIWLISSCVLIAAVIAVRAIFGSKMRAGLRYGLWALVLIRLLVPGTFVKSPVSIGAAAERSEIVRDYEALRGVDAIERTDSGDIRMLKYTLDASGLPVAPAQTTVSPTVGSAATYVPATASAESETPESGVPATEAPATPVPAAPIITATDDPGGKTTAVPVVASVVHNAETGRYERMQHTMRIQDILLRVWLIGAAAAAAVFIFTNIRFYVRLRSRRRKLDIDCPRPVFAVDGLTSSCLFLGTVYISSNTAKDEKQLRFVLEHELAHYRHGDHIFALLRCAAIALHWYNPLVWLAAELSRRDSELFADAGAISRLGEDSREGYGLTLIELSANRPLATPILSAATAMTNGKRELRRRVVSIAQKGKKGLFISLAALLVVLIAFGCAIGGSGRTADQDTPTEAPASEVPTDKPTDKPTMEPAASTDEPAADPDIVVFEDPAFEAAFREKYGVTGDIRKADLLQYTELDLSGCGLTNIKDVAKFTELQALYLCENEIRNVNPLAELKKLTVLNLRNNKINWLNGIAELEELIWLDLDNNRIIESSVLQSSKLSKLVYLSMNSNMLNDLYFCSAMPELDTLIVNDNSIRDISGIKGLSKLVHFECADNRITDFSVLDTLPKLVKVYTDNNWDETPSDEWFIEQAWPYAQAANEANGFSFDRSNAQVDRRDEKQGFCEVRFGSYPYTGLTITFRRESKGEWVYGYSDILAQILENLEELGMTGISYSDIDRSAAQLSLADRIVTADELSRAGYTLEGTSDDYLKAAKYFAGCKCALYTDCGEDNVLRCSEAGVGRVSFYSIPLFGGAYECTASLCFLPVNPSLFAEYYCDVGCGICEPDGRYPGAISMGCTMSIERQSDGSFSCQLGFPSDGGLYPSYIYPTSDPMGRLVLYVNDTFDDTFDDEPHYIGYVGTLVSNGEWVVRDLYGMDWDWFEAEFGPDGWDRLVQRLIPAATTDEIGFRNCVKYVMLGALNAPEKYYAGFRTLFESQIEKDSETFDYCLGTLNSGDRAVIEAILNG